MKIAINGFGRIGRQILRIILEKNSALEVVAVNDLTDNHTLAHLFEFDSTYGRYPGSVKLVSKNEMEIDGKIIKILAEPNPEKLPWKEMEIDLVLECTGRFREHEKASLHLNAGAKKVLLSAPAKGNKGADATLVMGVNENQYDPENHHIISNASCTTNCLTPVVKVLNDHFTIKKGLMTTIHASTNDQRILDLPHKDLRRGRSCLQNIIPTTTGAAKAVAKVLPELEGKLNGMAVRVPTATVSLVDLTIEAEKSTTAEAVNEAFKQFAKNHPAIMKVEERSLVSKDFQQDPHSATVDAQNTMVIDGNMIKVLAWYDNEWGYSARMVDVAEYILSR